MTGLLSLNLYIKKEFVGGCDIVKEMYENGELKKILEDKGIILINNYYLLIYISNNFEKNFLKRVSLDNFFIIY